MIWEVWWKFLSVFVIMFLMFYLCFMRYHGWYPPRWLFEFIIILRKSCDYTKRFLLDFFLFILFCYFSLFISFKLFYFCFTSHIHAGGWIVTYHWKGTCTGYAELSSSFYNSFGNNCRFVFVSLWETPCCLSKIGDKLVKIFISLFNVLLYLYFFYIIYISCFNRFWKWYTYEWRVR